MLREFNDSSGRRWRVWDISPTPHSRGASAAERRQLGVPAGWLCFDSAGERRRLSPIPTNWQECSDSELETLCGGASMVSEREAEQLPDGRTDRVADA